MNFLPPQSPGVARCVRIAKNTRGIQALYLVNATLQNVLVIIIPFVPRGQGQEEMRFPQHRRVMVIFI